MAELGAQSRKEGLLYRKGGGREKYTALLTPFLPCPADRNRSNSIVRIWIGISQLSCAYSVLDSFFVLN